MTESEIEGKIKEATFAYYTGRSKLTDDQFDTLIDQLREINPNNHLLKTSGWGYAVDEGKIRHIGKAGVGSLHKVKYPEVPHIADDRYTIMPKFDGLTIVVTSDWGIITAVTRGNGIEGKDVTNNVVTILVNKFPAALEFLRNFSGLISIRGEVMADYSSMDYFKQTGVVSTRLRNLAAGLINRNGVSPELTHLTFVPYYVRVKSAGDVFATRRSMLHYLAKNGFAKCPYVTAINNVLSPDEIKNQYEMWQESFLLDGVVFGKDEMENISDSDIDYTENELNAFAYKFPTDSVEVIIDDRIEWQVGSAGHVTPVAKFTPVEIDGVSVSSVTCHNAQFVIDSGIGVGSQIGVVRSGGVIPYITHVSTTVEPDIPKECPVCGSPLMMSGAYLVCKEESCAAKTRNLIDRFLASSVGIPLGLADKTITAWLENFPVSGSVTVKVDTLYDLLIQFKQVGLKNIASRCQLLQSKFGIHYGMLLYALEVKMEEKLLSGLTYQEFWYLMNFGLLGSENSSKIGHINPIGVDYSHFIGIPGLPHKLISTIMQNTMLIKAYASAFTFVESKTMLMQVGVTGDVSIPRESWVKKMASHGVKVSGLTKKSAYLVCNSPSSSEKTKKAEKYGIKIITEKQLYEILKTDYGVTVS